MENKKNVGQIIKEAREELGLSQRELAKKANIDNGEVSRIEAGKRLKPNVIVLKNLADVLDLSVVELMKVSGYSDLDINYGMDLDEKRSARDYINIINDYQRFYYDAYEDISKRRKIDFEVKSIIMDLIYRIKDNDILTQKITMNDILKKLEKADKLLRSNMDKFDSSKNPINDPITNFYHEKDIKKELRKNAITVKINPDIKISKKSHK